MDEFKKEQHRHVGPGGIKCPCCNDSIGKKKGGHVGKLPYLNQQARRRLKESLRKEVKEL